MLSDTYAIARGGRYEKFPQVGRLIVEDEVEIGANTTIDRAPSTRLEFAGDEIDNLVTSATIAGSAKMS